MLSDLLSALARPLEAPKAVIWCFQKYDHMSTALQELLKTPSAHSFALCLRVVATRVAFSLALVATCVSGKCGA